MRSLLLLLVANSAFGQRFSNFAKDENNECFCLPANQRCDPTLPIPRNAIKITGPVNTRIINSNPAALCSEQRVPCCFDVKPGAPPSGSVPDIGSLPVAQGSCGLQFPLERRTVPGQADFGEYPWMSLITTQSADFVGTGALVSPFYVLTVAHRLPRRNNRRGNLVVRLGDYDIGDKSDRPNYPVQTIPVAEVIIHPRFDRKTLANDIALLRLSQPAQLSHSVLPICLPERGQKFNGQRCHVSGWGKDLSGSFQNVMKEVDVPVVDSNACETILRTTDLSEFFRLDKQSFICAGGEPGKDSCEGDGGAPLVCKEPGRDQLVAVGLVAWGRLCGTNAPGVYVNLEFFSDFINSYIQQ